MVTFEFLFYNLEKRIHFCTIGINAITFCKLCVLVLVYLKIALADN